MSVLHPPHKEQLLLEKSARIWLSRAQVHAEHHSYKNWEELLSMFESLQVTNYCDISILCAFIILSVISFSLGITPPDMDTKLPSNCRTTV
jgi:hypothetical protein